MLIVPVVMTICALGFYASTRVNNKKVAIAMENKRKATPLLLRILKEHKDEVMKYEDGICKIEDCQRCRLLMALSEDK